MGHHPGRVTPKPLGASSARGELGSVKEVILGKIDVASAAFQALGESGATPEMSRKRRKVECARMQAFLREAASIRVCI